MMSDAKQAKLRAKIEAGQKRQSKRAALSENAAAAGDRLTLVARDHPLMLIAGGLAIGVALSTLFPKSPTRKLSRNAIGLIATIAELGLTYGKQALDSVGDAAEGASQPARDKFEQFGQAVSGGASKLKQRVASGRKD